MATDRTEPKETPMDKATVTYLLDGTTKVITGGYITTQLGPHSTIVHVSDRLGGQVSRVHLFRRAEHVAVERGVDA